MNKDNLYKKNNEEFSSKNALLLINDFLLNNKKKDLENYIKDIHNADIAEILQNLEPETRIDFVNKIGSKFDPEILTYLNDSLREELIDVLDIKQLATNSKTLDVDDAVDIVEDFAKSDQTTFLENIEENERKLIEEGLNYPEDSAGRLMQRNYVSVNDIWNVGEAIDYLRSNKKNLPEDFYDIYLVDLKNKISGIVPLGRLMGSKRTIYLQEIKNKETRIVEVATDQEEVAYLFKKYGLVSAPVIDKENKIIGSITVDDVVDVIEEEREEDILKLGGVGQTDIYDAVFNTTKSRFSWLFLNLLTAVVASVVIGFFQASIEKIVALAVLMPIVASMGGNAGTQTLTIAVRALAVKELTPTNALKIVFKETFIGGINGLIFALIISLVSMYWFNDTLLGIVIGVAMVLNLIVAGFAGTIIPLTLEKLKVDPALASGVILTTITDVFGFLSFLGLATLVLIWFYQLRAYLNNDIITKNDLIDYFYKGIKSKENLRIGVEHEKFILDKKSLKPLKYNEPIGIKNIFLRLIKDGWQPKYENDNLDNIPIIEEIVENVCSIMNIIYKSLNPENEHCKIIVENMKSIVSNDNPSV